MSALVGLIGHWLVRPDLLGQLFKLRFLVLSRLYETKCCTLEDFFLDVMLD